MNSFAQMLKSELNPMKNNIQEIMHDMKNAQVQIKDLQQKTSEEFHKVHSQIKDNNKEFHQFRNEALAKFRENDKKMDLLKKEFQFEDGFPNMGGGGNSEEYQNF